MITIGSFTKSPDGSFHGAIRSLNLNVRNVEIRPVERTADKAPDHRILVGQTELGAAWTVTKPDKPECLSVRLDDPRFPVAVNALLAQTAGGYELRWSRNPRV